MPQQVLARQVIEYQDYKKIKAKKRLEYNLSKMKRGALF